MDLGESVAFRAVDGQSNGRVSDADSTESGSVTRCENVQALRPRMNALLRAMGAFGKVLPSTRASWVGRTSRALAVMQFVCRV